MIIFQVIDEKTLFAEGLAAFLANERVVNVGVLFVSVPFGAIVESFIALQTS